MLTHISLHRCRFRNYTTSADATHIREETYALALRRLVNQQQREPFAAVFGSGTASSSDGQFFPAASFGRDPSRLNAHYGQAPGFKIYTHLSDRFSPFYTIA